MIPGSFSAMCIQAGITPEKISLAFKCFSLHNIDVGVDNNDFTPVSFAQVKAIIEKQVELSKK